MAKEYSKLPEKAEKNVLFIRIVIDVSPKVFQYHNIQTAPILTFLAGNELLGKRVGDVSVFVMISSIPITTSKWNILFVLRVLPHMLVQRSMCWYVVLHSC